MDIENINFLLGLCPCTTRKLLVDLDLTRMSRSLTVCSLNIEFKIFHVAFITSTSPFDTKKKVLNSYRESIYSIYLVS